MQGLKNALSKGMNMEGLQCALARFLFSKHMTIHVVKRKGAACTLFGRKLEPLL